MDSKEFKKMFSEKAKSHGFASAYGGWYKETSECIAVLELQKSNFGNYYQLNIKVFVQGFFGTNYIPNKELIKSSMGHVNSGETQAYKEILDFDSTLNDEIRKTGLENLFKNHIVPFTHKALSISGIKDLLSNGEIFVLPAVERELEAKT